MRNIIYIFFFLSLFCSAQTNQTVKTDNLEYYIQNKKIGLRDRTTKSMVVPCSYDFIGGFNKSGLSSVKKNGLWGFVNTKGAEVIKPQFQDAKSFSAELKLAPVKKNGKWGYINTLGQVKIAYTYEEVGGFSNGLACVKMNGKWGYINSLGKEIVPCKYENNYSMQKKGYAIVSQNGKFGVLSITGKILFNCQFDKSFSFNDEGYAVVIKDGKYGVISLDGKECAECKFDNASNISDGLVCVKRGDLWGYIDLTGNQILPFRFKYSANFSNNIVCVDDKNGSHIISKDTRTIKSFPESRFSSDINYFDDGNLFILHGDKEGVVDGKGNTILPMTYDDIKIFYGCGLIGVKKYDKWGFCDAKGSLKISYNYEEISYHFQNNVIAAKKNGKWGVIDVNGGIVTPFTYEIIDQNSSFMKTKNGDRFGALSAAGKQVLDCKYDEVGWFTQSLNYFPVKLNGKDGYADIYGNDTF